MTYLIMRLPGNNQEVYKGPLPVVMIRAVSDTMNVRFFPSKGGLSFDDYRLAAMPGSIGGLLQDLWKYWKRVNRGTKESGISNDELKENKKDVRVL